MLCARRGQCRIQGRAAAVLRFKPSRYDGPWVPVEEVHSGFDGSLEHVYSTRLGKQTARLDATSQRQSVQYVMNWRPLRTWRPFVGTDCASGITPLTMSTSTRRTFPSACPSRIHWQHLRRALHQAWLPCPVGNVPRIRNATLRFRKRHPPAAAWKSWLLHRPNIPSFDSFAQRCPPGRNIG